MTKPIPEYFAKSSTTPDLPLWPYKVSQQQTIITTYRLKKEWKSCPICAFDKAAKFFQEDV